MKRTAITRKSWIKRGEKPMKKVNPERRARTRKAYTKHLHSKYWKTMQALVYQRDDGRCQQCGIEVGNTWHLAHRTNARFGHENLDDVEVNCPDCNLAERASRAWYTGSITH